MHFELPRALAVYKRRGKLISHVRLKAKGNDDLRDRRNIGAGALLTVSLVILDLRK